MALADPQSVTINAVATPLPRSGLSLDEGKFLSANGEVTLTVMHSRKNRSRHTVKLQKSSIVADPLVPSTNVNVSYSAHIVIDMPNNGVSLTEAGYIANALVAWATPANVAKVLGGES